MPDNQKPDPETEEFVNKNYDALCHFFAKMILNSDEAPCLANETFVKLIPRLHDPTIRNLEKFFWQIAWNVLHDYREWLPPLSPSYRGPGNTPGQSSGLVEKDERFTELHNAIARLVDIQREVLIFRYFHKQNLKFKDIAEIMGKPLGTITNAYTRALIELRHLLDKGK